MTTSKLTIALVSPSSTFEKSQLKKALNDAQNLDLVVAHESSWRSCSPSFLNGTKKDRLAELKEVEALDVKALWSTRGGCGAIELWQDYDASIYADNNSVLIGYSDISLLHLARFYRAQRIGIHGPVFFDLSDEKRANLPSIRLLIEKRALDISYPPLKSLNHFLASRLQGELIVMNLTMLQCAIGLINENFLRGKILAIEDINEPHYKVYRSIMHLKNAGLLAGLKALIIGQFNLDRSELISGTMIPMANELGIPLFDWPIFGHEKPNWPLLFGAKASLNRIEDELFTLSYLEQHDHTPTENL